MMVFGRESGWFGRNEDVDADGEALSNEAWQDAIYERAMQLDDLRECVYPRAMERAERVGLTQREHQDRRSTIVPKPLRVGQLVYVRDEHRTPKVGELWLGPMRILGQDKGGNYRVANMDGQALLRVYPIQLMKLARELAKADQHFEVDWIRDHEVTPEGRKFLVRWKGYREEDDSWVDEEDFGEGDAIPRYFAHLEAEGHDIHEPQ